MTKIQLSQNSSIEGHDLREIPVEEWLAEGTKLFGEDMTLWKFKCPNCGHVQSISDFIELRRQKIVPADFDPGKVVYYSCIGRFDTRLKKVGTVWDKISPCNYTNGGLFCFANTFVISDSGERVPVFPFAAGE